MEESPTGSVKEQKHSISERSLDSLQKHQFIDLPIYKKRRPML